MQSIGRLAVQQRKLIIARPIAERSKDQIGLEYHALLIRAYDSVGLVFTCSVCSISLGSLRLGAGVTKELALEVERPIETTITVKAKTLQGGDGHPRSPNAAGGQAP